MTSALDGIKVLELTQGVCGPFCAMLLADAGSQVIKAEPVGGDYSRQMGPPFIKQESALFLALNRNKRSIVIDHTKHDGRSLLLRLASKADIVIADFAPYLSNPFWLSYEDVVKTNPQVIYCSISPFGEKGPLANRPGSELAVQAESNAHGGLGVIGEPPLRLGTDEANSKTALVAYQGILSALFHRFRSGEGQKVSVSMMGAVLLAKSCLSIAMSDPDDWWGFHLDSWTNPPDFGYQTKDRPIYFSLRRGAQEDYDALLIDLGMEECLSDPRFGEGGRNAVGVGKYGAEVKYLWEKAFKDKTAHEVIALIRKYNGDAVPLHDYESLMADPQVAALGVVAEIEHPTSGRIKMILPPWQLSATPENNLRTPPPLLGQHSEEILKEVGISGSDIKALKESGAIA